MSNLYYEQLSFFDTPQSIYIMPLSEMNEHEWIVCWSGGKDSTASIIKMHELGIPIKYIVFVLMMWDDSTPAILPEMYDFVMCSKEVFENWGYTFLIIKSEVTAKQRALRIIKNSPFDSRNGSFSGAMSFVGGGCSFQRFKEFTLRKLNLQNEYQIVGYAVDEVERLHRLNNKLQSILVEQNICESETFSICRQYNLLSPLYELGFNRDGCWFCPNCSNFERNWLRYNHPELVDQINWLISITDLTAFKNGFRNNWVQDYLDQLDQIDDHQISFIF